MFGEARRESFLVALQRGALCGDGSLHGEQFGHSGVLSRSLRVQYHGQAHARDDELGQVERVMKERRRSSILNPS